ncbi:hypothetical protein SAMN02910369_02053 [Lachnospiraceae bacterium NE2001]|nr:hypothetical protein SAMN02910369_02053 [Lachnospiraceae bacterium NE2001]
MFIKVRDYNDGQNIIILNTDNIVKIKETFDNRFNTGGNIYIIETVASNDKMGLSTIAIDHSDAHYLFTQLGITM